MSVYADDPTDMRQFIAEAGDLYWWKPRFGKRDASAYGLDTAFDPHTPTGIARCPVCFNATIQRSQSSVCTTCWGTTWTGGFAPTQTIQALVTSGSHRLAADESGLLMAVQGVWLYSMPQDAVLLPEDLIIRQSDTATRYLVGELGQTPGIWGTEVVRVNQLFPQAPDAPWQLVPLP